MTTTELHERSFVIACTAASIMAAGAAWVLQPGVLTTPIILVSLLPPLAIAIVRARNNGMVDPLAVFALCYAAYNGVLLLQLNSATDLHDAPIEPDQAMMLRAGFMSALGALGLVTGWLLWGRNRPVAMRPGTHAERAASFVVGVVFYLIGIVLYLAQYWQIGGYMQAVAMDLGQRFELLRTTVSMPYEGFVVGGLALMVYASIGSNTSRSVLSGFASVLWLGMVILQGDRRLALQMVMALGVIVGTMRPSVTKLRPRALVVIACAYLLAALFGQYRTLIYDLAAGRSTLKQAQVAAESEESSINKPQDSELGGPYMSVLFYSRQSEPLRWGSSYAESIPAVLPRVLYPGAKTRPISLDLDEALHEGMGTVYGLGFSPVAEGFANFGYAGPFVAILSWSLLFQWIAALRYHSLGGMVLCATLLQECVNSNRIDFRYVYFESIYCSIAAVLAVWIVKAALVITNRNTRPLPPAPFRIGSAAAQGSSGRRIRLHADAETSA